MNHNSFTRYHQSAAQYDLNRSTIFVKVAKIDLEIFHGLRILTSGAHHHVVYVVWSGGLPNCFGTDQGTLGQKYPLL